MLEEPGTIDNCHINKMTYAIGEQGIILSREIPETYRKQKHWG
jgi:hypothetical protein